MIWEQISLSGAIIHYNGDLASGWVYSGSGIGMNYQIEVPVGWSGTVWPEYNDPMDPFAYWYFNPQERNYSNVQQNYSGQNYEGQSF